MKAGKPRDSLSKPKSRSLWLAGLALGLTGLLGCSHATAWELSRLPEDRADAAIVPGCPSEDDGSLSQCQARRILWAWRLLNRGDVDAVITSGSAAYNRYVEAEALAAGLVALGASPDRIFLEPEALHTDENFHYSLQIAQREGFTTLVSASDAIQAQSGCTMLEAWGADCRVNALDPKWSTEQARLALQFRLADVRTPPVDPHIWLPLDEREDQRADLTGFDRPSSLVLYAQSTFTRLFGQNQPPQVPPRRSTVRTYADLHEHGWGRLRFDQ